MAETIKRMQKEHCGFDQIERIVRPDGQLRYVRAVAVPVLEQGVFKGFAGTTIDVTEQELLTQELRREKAYLSEAQSLTHTGSTSASTRIHSTFITIQFLPKTNRLSRPNLRMRSARERISTSSTEFGVPTALSGFCVALDITTPLMSLASTSASRLI